MDDAGPQAVGGTPVPRDFDPRGAGMAARETTIDEVTSRWGGDYKIGGCPLEGYGALRQDGSGSHVFADTPGELWDRLAVDFLSWAASGARG
jgi:hypothetical protein